VTPLPVRGPEVRRLDLPLPPGPMPLLRGARPLKRWRYVGVFDRELMLCVGDARVGVARRRWWAVAEPDGTLSERTTASRGGIRLEAGRVLVDAGEVRIDLELEESDGVEVVSPSGRQYIWTRKQAGARARGTVTLAGRERRVDCEAFVDESAGYHERHTAWRWSAGRGRGAGGERIAWNLVTGVHDSPESSERTLWIDGRPREVGPVRFTDDLSRVAFAEGGALEFEEWCAREEHTNGVLFSNDYRQPFGTFGGELPGGLHLAEGWGVVEEHDVRW
jgi:hypothetical protein